MADFIDPGPDPAFPDRPDHPHYRLLAEMAQELDNDLVTPTAIAERERIDLDSVVYLTKNRAMMLTDLARRGFAMGLDQERLIQVGMLEGFMFGYLFALNRPDLP